MEIVLKQYCYEILSQIILHYYLLFHLAAELYDASYFQ